MISESQISRRQRSFSTLQLQLRATDDSEEVVVISCSNWLLVLKDLRSPTRHLAAVSVALVKEYGVGLLLTCAGDGTIRCSRCFDKLGHCDVDSVCLNSPHLPTGDGVLHQQ